MKKHLIFLLTMMFAILAGATSTHFPDAALVVQDVNITPVLVSGVTMLGSFVELVPVGALGVYAMVSVPKGGTNIGKPSPKQDKIILFRWSDVVAPVRDINGILIATDLTLNVGAVAIAMYATKGTISFKQTPEGDVDAKAWLQELSFDHPGNSLLIDEFLENNLNEYLGALILPYDATADKTLCGAPEAPLQIEPESMDNKDGNKTSMVVKSVMRGPRAAHYQGVIPTLDTDGGA